MGSRYLIVPLDGRLYVGYDMPARYWWVVDDKGSYGGAENRDDACKIALDASASAYHGQRRIVVQDRWGYTAFIITRVRQPPSPQFFQEDVE